MKVPLLDLKAQFVSIEREIREAIDEVLDTQRFIMGPNITALESEIAAFVGCAHGIGVSSGTDAILCALMAIGVGPGDEVIVPTFTFFSTAGCVHRLGATPVFADIEPDTYNMDVSRLPDLITPRTKVIMPVHLFGQCADMDPLMELVAGRDITVVEDAAQALSAKHKGRPAGSLGHIACFSFFPSKNLGGFGDGGMITTNDEKLAECCALLRNHGAHPKYYHKLVGANFRLDAIQAAVLRVKLNYLESWSEGRRRNAGVYGKLLANAPVTLPVVRGYNQMIFNQFVIRSAQRDAIREHLTRKGIGTEVYYPVPLHLQECFASLGYSSGSLPIAEEAVQQVLALPIYAELTDEDLTYVADCIKSFG
ncbi:MAG: DegT/DnrJ/EryC1/StrS family aminotransferase [Phycisphaerae bacterium]|nr:DegT/DnrJ/EryC1/StrS family aminotransferase [Phycisphaerae bacterium]